MNRDPGFYKTPVVKSLLVLTSASTFLNTLAFIRNSHPAILLVVRVWALPSIGMWLAAALILYQCRLLERRRGSASFMSYAVLSSAVSMTLYTALLSMVDRTTVPLKLLPGAMVYSLVGSLALEYMWTVVPRQSRLAQLPLSSNLPLYVLSTLFSSISVSSAALAISGLVGGLLMRLVGVSLPRPPGWLSSPLAKVLARDPPPRLFSGASLSVQAQQRTDEIEQLMVAMYNRQHQRRLVVGRPVRQELPLPPEQLVEQLLAMGFTRQESVQALQHTGNNVDVALQLLTARQLQQQQGHNT